jgi:hypothetical protein
MAFDVDKYTATSVSVNWDDLDLEKFRTEPLNERSLRTLRYMTDVEYHTVCYTRDLLTTPSHKEADMSAFMTMWNREEFVAVHMAWGAANEWSAIQAYNRMADIEEDPVLAELLKRIAKQEARHVAFYTSQARDRLAKSKKAQVLARLALSNFWQPVGSSIMERSEVVHVMNHLMSGPDGRKAAHKIDSAISGLPGMEGLRIVEDSLDKLGIAA